MKKGVDDRNRRSARSDAARDSRSPPAAAERGLQGTSRRGTAGLRGLLAKACSGGGKEAEASDDDHLLEKLKLMIKNEPELAQNKSSGNYKLGLDRASWVA